MIKVMFVDDEVLAMEYLHKLIDWEAHGYQIVGHAINGRRALELFDKERPEIVISDIKMGQMDGLELASQLKKRNPEVVVVLLSAYRDFEYAQKGIEYGVSNYLLKHELCKEKLLTELDKIRIKLESGSKKKKIYHKYFTRQLIYDQMDVPEMEGQEFGNRFFMLFLHKSDAFRDGELHEVEWKADERTILEDIWEQQEENMSYISDVQLTENNLIVLYKIENITSKYAVSSMIERKSKEVEGALRQIQGCYFNLIYSHEIYQNEISSVFRRMSRLIHYAVFWNSCSACALNRLIDAEAEKKIAWNEMERELRNMIEDGTEEPDGFIQYMFEQTLYPTPSLSAFRELLHTLENFIRDMETQEGISRGESDKEKYRVEEIKEYYVRCIHQIYESSCDKKNQRYSKLVQDILRYIRKNYSEELSLESLGDAFQMNGVYLGQMFKKEMGVTFLKYLTSCRIEHAKRFLDLGDRNVSEVAGLVGYKSSQYFSQIFLKSVGVTPQEYRRWNRKREKRDI